MAVQNGVDLFRQFFIHPRLELPGVGAVGGRAETAEVQHFVSIVPDRRIVQIQHQLELLFRMQRHHRLVFRIDRVHQTVIPVLVVGRTVLALIASLRAVKVHERDHIQCITGAELHGSGRVGKCFRHKAFQRVARHGFAAVMPGGQQHVLRTVSDGQKRQLPALTGDRQHRSFQIRRVADR